MVMMQQTFCGEISTLKLSPRWNQRIMNEYSLALILLPFPILLIFEAESGPFIEIILKMNEMY